MTAPCLSLTGTRKQVGAFPLAPVPTVILPPCGYPEQLAFVPSLLFSPSFLGSHSCSHEAINLGFRWLLRARNDACS